MCAMRRSLVRVYIHIIWATWDRAPLLTPAIRQLVHRALARRALDMGCSDVTVGGVEDHVHVLLAIPSTVTAAFLVANLKGSTSHLVNHTVAPGSGFRWQGRYGAFSMELSSLDRVRDYIERQEQHHHAATYHGEWEQSEAPADQPGEGRGS